MSSVVDELILQYADRKADIVPAECATKILEKLREEHSEDLAVWLDSLARAVIRERLTSIIRSRRSRARSDAPKRRFAHAVEQGAEAVARHVREVAAVSFFDTRFNVGDNIQRRFGDMTGADHLFVARSFESSANHDLMLAAFHRAVAKRVGKKITADVLTEDQVRSMRDSMVPQAA